MLQTSKLRLRTVKSLVSKITQPINCRIRIWTQIFHLQSLCSFHYPPTKIRLSIHDICLLSLVKGEHCSKLFRCGLTPNSLDFALSRLPGSPVGRPGTRSWLSRDHTLWLLWGPASGFRPGQGPDPSGAPPSAGPARVSHPWPWQVIMSLHITEFSILELTVTIAAVWGGV